MRGARLLLTLAMLAGCTAPPSPSPANAQPAAPGPRREPPLRVVTLLKAEPAAVEAALGPPAVRRTEGEGEAWLYAESTGCSIQLTFFKDRTGTLLVSNAEYKTPPAVSEAACLRLIADQP